MNTKATHTTWTLEPHTLAKGAWNIYQEDDEAERVAMCWDEKVARKIAALPALLSAAVEVSKAADFIRSDPGRFSQALSDLNDAIAQTTGGLA